MTLLTNSKGGTVQASGKALEALMASGWQEVKAPAPASKAEPKATPRKRKTTPKSE